MSKISERLLTIIGFALQTGKTDDFFSDVIKQIEKYANSIRGMDFIKNGEL